jgi:hypothetical protein
VGSRLRVVTRLVELDGPDARRGPLSKGWDFGNGSVVAKSLVHSHMYERIGKSGRSMVVGHW